MGTISRAGLATITTPPRRAYNDDHEAYEARRYCQNRNSSADVRGYRDEGYAQNNGAYARPARSQREHLAANPYSGVDRPLFTSGQLKEDSGSSPQRLDHPFDPDYLHWRETELTRHDGAYRDWRRAQADHYDTTYSTWRQSRRDQFSKDFKDWRNTQASATTGQNATDASIGSSKVKNTSRVGTH